MTTSTMTGESGSNRKNTWIPVVITFAVVFILWQISDSALLYPIRLVVTFVHESGHALTAILTGGSVIGFEVMPSGAGIAYTMGGNRFFITQMGYLGAALFGSVLLYLTNRLNNTKSLAAVLSIFFIGCAALYTINGSILIIGPIVALGFWLLADHFTKQRRWFYLGMFAALAVTLFQIMTNLTLSVGAITGIVLLLMAVFFSNDVLRAVLNVLALLIGLNALDDIWFLFNHVGAQLNSTPNDASNIANLTHTPTILWIILWGVLSMAMMAFAGYMAAKHRR